MIISSFLFKISDSVPSVPCVPRDLRLHFHTDNDPDCCGQVRGGLLPLQTKNADKNKVSDL